MSRFGLITNTFFILISGLFSAMFNIALAVLGFYIYVRLYNKSYDNTGSCKGLAIRRLFLADAVMNSIGIGIAIMSTCVHMGQYYNASRKASEYGNIDRELTASDLDMRGGSLSTSLRGCISCGSLGVLIAISALFWGNTQSCSNIFPNQVYRLMWSYLIANYVFLASIALCSCLVWSGVGAYTSYYTTTSGVVRLEEKEPLAHTTRTTFIRSTTAP